MTGPRWAQARLQRDAMPVVLEWVEDEASSRGGLMQTHVGGKLAARLEMDAGEWASIEAERKWLSRQDVVDVRLVGKWGGPGVEAAMVVRIEDAWLPVGGIVRFTKDIRGEDLGDEVRDMLIVVVSGSASMLVDKMLEDI